jgi:hypothetical protein
LRVAILKNVSHAVLRQLGKKAITAVYQASAANFEKVTLPDYNSLAELLDPKPIVLGTGDEIDWKRASEAELLIWEWGWTRTPAQKMLEIKRRLAIPTLAFPGPIDRFWRELEAKDLDIQFEAAAATDAIGTMLSDTIPFFQMLAPQAHVFHLPVPVDVAAFRSWAVPDEKRDPNLWLLTAPTRFTGSGSQAPIATLLAFREVAKVESAARGLCFGYDDNELAEAKAAVAALGLAERVQVRPYLRPIQRYLSLVSRCWAGICMPHGMLQGRNAMTAACLGIPLVVSQEIETHRQLYPELSVPWYATGRALELSLQLARDRAFRARAIAQASAAIEHYSVENCRARLAAGARTAMQGFGETRRA